MTVPGPDAPAARIPFGFLPGEISSLLNRHVIAEHASEAAFIWTLRRQAARAPHFTLTQLVQLDGRLIAHLAGLQVAGDTGWRAAVGTLADGGAGAVFTNSHLAFARQDLDGMRHTLALAVADPGHAAAFADALAWLPFDTVEAGVRRLAASPLTAHRELACRVLGAHRDGGPFLHGLLADSEPAVRARAARAAGDMGWQPALPALAPLTADSDADTRFWAARALALAGDTAAARDAFDTGRALPRLAPHAIETGMRFGDPDWARDTIRMLAADPATRRQALHAVGAFGDPMTLPWVVGQCADPALAAPAGAALAMITGADLKRLDLDTDRPETDTPMPDGEAELPWPDGERVATWWHQQAGRFPAGQRHLCGEPVSAPAAARVLRGGFQHQRAAAALELVRLDPARPLFDVKARADRQRTGLTA